LRLVAAVGAVVLVLDQITKIWAVAALDDRIIDLFWTARFRLIYNTGSAFSLGEGIGRWLGILIAFVVVGVLWYARTLPDRRARFLLGMIVGDADGSDAEGSDVDVSDAEGSDVDDVDSDVAADAEDRKNDVELEASNDGDE
jgi:signal peptidase II